MNAASNNFPYPKVHTKNGDIRLLSILPQTDAETQVHCVLLKASLNDKYVTISYEWGDPKTTVPILLDGRVFYITRNLEACLKALRSTNGHKNEKVWIDAICINQVDLRERSEQVQLMRRIYGSAVFSILWLGDPTRACAAALMALQLEKRFPGQLGPAHISTLLKRLPKAVSHVVAEEMLYLRNLSAWERIWILQEICLAKEVVLMYGSAVISEAAWSAVQSFMTSTMTLPSWETGGSNKDAVLLSAGSRLWSMRMTITRRPELGIPLAMALSFLCGSVKATDPRDYVYALMGIVIDMPPVIADYGKHAVDVFCDLTFSHITHTSSLSILNTPIHGENITILDGVPLPSWAVDLTKGASFRLGASAKNDNLANTAILYQAGIPESEIELQNLLARWPCQRPTSRTLSLGGARLDRIRKIVPLANWSRLKTFEDYRRAFTVAFPLKILPSFYSEGAIDAFWRTLVCDYHCSGERRIDHSDLTTFGCAFRSIMDMKEAAIPTKVHNQNSMPSHEAAVEDLSADVEAAKQNILNGFGIGRIQAFGYTISGHMGMFPYGARGGDEICIFWGAETPYVIRAIESSQSVSESGGEEFKLIGPAYVHGWMDGEVFWWLEEGRIIAESFSIV